MEKTYRDYSFGDYYSSELEDVEYWADGDGYMKDGIYMTEDEVVDEEWNNFIDWVDEQEK